MEKKKLLIGGAILTAVGIGSWLLLRKKSYAPGTLLRDPASGAIYAINNAGEAQWIRSLTTLNRLYPNPQPIELPASEIAKIKKGTDIAGISEVSACVPTIGFKLF